MLTKRTQVLFEEDEYKRLARLASKQNTSVGSLIRRAVRSLYFHPNSQELQHRAQAYQHLLQWQHQIGTFKDINYRQLIDDGRTR